MEDKFDLFAKKEKILAHLKSSKNKNPFKDDLIKLVESPDFNKNELFVILILLATLDTDNKD